eukprot:scaffold1982_cov93-Amphora_coffeaeformis.AAC.51
MQKSSARGKEGCRYGRRGGPVRSVRFGHGFVQCGHIQSPFGVFFGIVHGQPCDAFPQDGCGGAMLMTTVFAQNQLFVSFPNVVRICPANHVGVLIFQASAVCGC